MKAREYLERCMPTEKHVADFLNPVTGLPRADNNNGWTYDGELGWVLKDSVRQDGLDGAWTFYRYELSGARRRVNCPDGPCRVRTYGNSFTHCDQVSDGETWQEYLSGHLNEPVENYGVGGYSVYQAFLRMKRVEASTPSDYVVLNVWCDDHFRNLDAWRTIRFGARTPCGFPLPHLRVDPDTSSVEERENPAPTHEDLHRLLDLDWVCETFADDPVLECALAGQSREVSSDDVPVSFGVPHAAMIGAQQDGLSATMAKAALLASRWVVEQAAELVAARDAKLMVVLSHSAHVIRPALEGKPLWDQSFVDWLSTTDLPVLDTRDAHREDFARFKGTVDEYLKRYYIGHYAPAGNFFAAMAMKDAIVDWLDPKPPAYVS